MKKRILLVEDDSGIRELCRLHLNRQGFEVDARSSLNIIDAERFLGGFDGFVLDWNLPGASGIEIIREIRKHSSLAQKPILMITARGDESDVVAALGAGADDYVVKPFSVAIFLARIAALFRRHTPSAENADSEATAIEYGGLKILLNQARVELDGQEVTVTPSELKLLWCLASEPGRVFDRTLLCEKIRGFSIVSTERSIDNFILSLRKKLGPASAQLESVRGLGYRFRELS